MLTYLKYSNSLLDGEIKATDGVNTLNNLNIHKGVVFDSTVIVKMNDKIINKKVFKKEVEFYIFFKNYDSLQIMKKRNVF